MSIYLHIVKSTFHVVINNRELMRSIFETASMLVTNIQVSPSSSATSAHLSQGRSDLRIEQEEFGAIETTGREITFMGPDMFRNRRAGVQMSPVKEPAKIVKSSLCHRHSQHKHRPS